MNKIVVGVDGSDAAAEALRWAVKQAKATGASVDAVYAWDPGARASLGLPPLTDWEPLREAAEARPAEIVREAVGDEIGVHVIPKLATGNAGKVLVARSAGADLLVVGSRGLGRLKRMFLGSVGDHCTAHSHCPVVIVHHAPVPEAQEPKRRTLSAGPAS